MLLSLHQGVIVFTKVSNDFRFPTCGCLTKTTRASMVTKQVLGCLLCELLIRMYLAKHLWFIVVACVIVSTPQIGIRDWELLSIGLNECGIFQVDLTALRLLRFMLSMILILLVFDQGALTVDITVYMILVILEPGVLPTFNAHLLREKTIICLH